MVNAWIKIQKDYFSDNLTTLATPERLAFTSHKIMDLSSSKNISQVVTAVQKSMKSSQSATSWIDSGT